MAALTRTDVHRRLPLGDRVLVTFRATTNATPNQATEWIVTGLSKVDAILAAHVLGPTPASISLQKNAQGTGVAEGTNPGDLGIESSAASTLVEITVLGRP